MTKSLKYIYFFKGFGRFENRTFICERFIVVGPLERSDTEDFLGYSGTEENKYFENRTFIGERYSSWSSGKV